MGAETSATGVAIIDLDALARNYHLIRRKAKPAEASAVVKANGYGLGMVPVAKRLVREGCTKFFVATLAEGYALREALTKEDIYVLEGLPSGIEPVFADLRLTPVLNSLEQVERWAQFARSSSNGPAPAVIHIDTGMTRLGLGAREVRAVASNRPLLDGVRLEYVMTHLACSDEPSHPLNAQQLAAFDELRALLPAAKTSIGASAGSLLGQSGDLLRAGIGLYGGNPFIDRPNPMEAVLRLQGRILQVREVEQAATVGYGATHEVTPPARLATVGVGYADGYLRSLSNRGVAVLDGVRVPVVGRVSMDLISVDVSEVAPEQARSGRMVDLVGGGVSLDEVAQTAGTISYEILTGLGSRLRRVYEGSAEEG